MVAKTNKLNKVYETDASQVKGKALEVIIPENVLEIQEAVKKHANITARGGGTGLAGGAVPFEGIIIDLSKLNKVIKIEKNRHIAEVEAGCILDDLNEHLEKQNLEFPVQPSSHSVCTIGGMIATDAVGNRAVKYGRTSKWVEWIDIIDGKGMLHRKGKTDLADFAGLEGTTGIIVRAGLKLIEKPERTISILRKDKLEEVLFQVRELKRNLNISAIEFIDKNVSSWLGLDKGYHLLVEYESLDGGLIGDDYEKAMELRDKIYPVLAERGYLKIEDPKILLDRIYPFIKWLEENNIPVYGHLSVGILHPCFSSDQEHLIEKMIKIVKKLGGQISGEHGIGIVKKSFVEENDKKIFELIKQRNDPEYKFNKGKIV